LSHVSSEIGAGTFSTIVSFIDFKQFQNDALWGFNPSSSSFSGGGRASGCGGGGGASGGDFILVDSCLQLERSM